MQSNYTIKIVKDRMFAYDIEVSTGDSHAITDVITKQRINFAKNIEIGDHVWVAAHVSILKGSVIPNIYNCGDSVGGDKGF